ncbi:hypothetical protein KY290_018407 [Solanum tuberosum]|uniref:Uncharacterized protein n=1 Tax=Solanum tuberosum TaxID=4113 RepID=A0ABQ7VE76_SOLTU|nr:hypothetical protein KY284_016967 [Solanum tuberosum]KAH0762334.1 hypothetical protein KY290_018407 [Solanum tuberosum]
MMVRITDGPLIPTVKNNEGNDVSKPKEKYGEADYKMLGKNAKANAYLYVDLDLMSLIASHVVPPRNKYGILYRMFMKVQLKFENLELLGYAPNMKPSR